MSKAAPCRACIQSPWCKIPRSWMCQPPSSRRGFFGVGDRSVQTSTSSASAIRSSQRKVGDFRPASTSQKWDRATSARSGKWEMTIPRSFASSRMCSTTRWCRSSTPQGSPPLTARISRKRDALRRAQLHPGPPGAATVLQNGGAFFSKNRRGLVDFWMSGCSAIRWTVAS